MPKCPGPRCRVCNWFYEAVGHSDSCPVGRAEVAREVEQRRRLVCRDFYRQVNPYRPKDY